MGYKVLYGLILSLGILGCQKAVVEMQIETIEVEAPFGRTEITIPNFEGSSEFLITNYGAAQGDKEKTSKAIEKAISEAHESGGGKVIIPQGEWLTGKIHLQTNVNLHLEEGAVLLFSEDPGDYLPPVHTTWEGMECYNYSPLIYAYECKNIAITGKGELKAKMDVWREWFSRPSGHMNSLKRLYNLAAENSPVQERQMVNDSANFRPQFIQFNRSENILLEGVKITQSPFWVIHPYLSKNIVIRDVEVWAHGHNNDGVDPEMSQNILIENSLFDQGDDAIAIKSGRNQDAWRLNTPSRNIIIRNSTVKNGHQLLALGSELSGGIENIFMTDCKVEESAKLNHLLFIKTNERRGGYVKNIYMENIQAGAIDAGVLGIETEVLYQWRDLVPTYERRLTQIADIFLSDIKVNSADFISRVKAQRELPVQNVSLKNVRVDSLGNTEHLHDYLMGFKED